MARHGQVSVRTTLNMRKKPGGAVIGSLPNGQRLLILDTADGWHHVQVGRKKGFVSADFVLLDHERPTGGTRRRDTRFRFDGKHAVAPDGTVFAKKFRLGVFNSGTTSIAKFVTRNAALFPGVAPSLLRVMDAVSANEGKLEAINTWDNAILTFGCFQWTVGTDDARGELPALLDRLKTDDPEAFERCFGQFGLDVVDVRHAASDVPRGRISLDGRTLRRKRDKEVLRSLEWAYRFWRAGHDDAVRAAQIRHAIDRINVFYRNPGKRIAGRFVGDYVTSEYGVALLLDQHVNRPGHVPKILARAVDQVGGGNPSRWGFAEEKRLIDRYLALRLRTSMTDPAARAQRTRAAVSEGRASDERGSFVLPAGGQV